MQTAEAYRAEVAHRKSLTPAHRALVRRFRRAQVIDALMQLRVCDERGNLTGKVSLSRAASALREPIATLSRWLTAFRRHGYASLNP